MTSFARRRTRVVLAAVAVLAALLVPFALWLRSSALVAVEHVKVTGARGPQAAAIRRALTAAARDMTVLDVRHDALQTAVEPFPVVRAVRARTDFPHGMTIAVRSYRPVAAIQSRGRLTAVAGDGTLLPDQPARRLPLVGVRDAPVGRRVRDRDTLGAVGVLATAPPALRARVQRVYRGPHGLAATVAGGPKLYFGGPARLAAKWGAAAQVLAHRSSRGARYVDLRVPERPVAGGLLPRTENPKAPL